MKVTKRMGLEDWKTSTECPSCTSELELEADDVEYRNLAAAPDEAPVWAYGYTCPVCGEFNTDRLRVAPHAVSTFGPYFPPFIKRHAQARAGQ